jgi:hypothetical protein
MSSDPDVIRPKTFREIGSEGQMNSHPLGSLLTRIRCIEVLFQFAANRLCNPIEQTQILMDR